jgi:hypothetical protein
MMYLVTVHYLTRRGNKGQRSFEIEADDLNEAMDAGRRYFDADMHHRTSQLTSWEGRPLVTQPGFTTARVVHAGENLQQVPKRDFHVGGVYKLRNWLGSVVLQARFLTAAGKDTVVVEREADAKVHTMGYRQFEDLATPRERVEYWSVYPPLKGESAGRTFKSTTGPVHSSMYGVENLVQIKVTFLGDQIIAKEIIEP